ncbi:hypothetical protein [Streptomyces sp. NRRL F-4474]|uniref:hypothetical protein n=1 Tax=Streptomyces sp. NRRL F-4474 TaxID=1463851 RepID=UPI0004C967F7|nr:hypothetical protein [Streptomyces sp. NRRL F-4474]
MRHALALAPEQREALRAFAESLPREAGARPAPPPPAYEDYPAGVAPLPAAGGPEPAVHGVAELVRDVRRLTGDRLRQVLELAAATRGGAGPGGEPPPGSRG